jgi:pimeloyl-ACP methyl ester carboxylesterase
MSEQTSLPSPVMAAVTSTDGTRIAFDKLGSGPPVIFVCGATCFRDLPPIRAMAEALASKLTVFHYDRRGRGDSGDTAPYAVTKEIDDIAALIVVAGGSAILYGHSSGGALALEATLALGERVRALAIYEAPYSVDAESEAEDRAFAARIADLVAKGRRGDAIAAFWSGIGMPDEMIDGARESPAWPAFEALAHTLVYDSTVASGRAPLARAAAIAVPTLVMYADHSYEFMRTIATQLAGAIPTATLRAMPGGHEGNPAAITAALVELAEVAARRRAS